MTHIEEFPVFENDAGKTTLFVGVKTFVCKGASEPHDHPHVSLTMGEKDVIVCPYCSTRFVYRVQEGGGPPSPSHPPHM